MSDIIFYDYPTLLNYAVLSYNGLSTNVFAGTTITNGYYGNFNGTGSISGTFTPSGSPSGLNQTDRLDARTDLDQLITDVNARRNSLPSEQIIPEQVYASAQYTKTFFKNINYYCVSGLSYESVNVIFDAENDPNGQFFIYSPIYLSLNGSCTFTLINGANAANIFWIVDGPGGSIINLQSASSAMEFYGNLLCYSIDIRVIGPIVNFFGRIYSYSSSILFGNFGGPGSINIQNVFYTPVNPEPGPGPGPEPGPTPISNICFLGNTSVSTDQGLVLIKNIKPSVHTIHNEAIVAVTRSTAIDKYLVCFEKDSLGEGIPSEQTIMSKDHKVLYEGELIKAYRFIEMFENVKKVKYNGEILYNIVMKNYRKIVANNMICETLHPKNIIAKVYSSMFYENKIMAIEELNGCILKNDSVGYSKVVRKIGK
jgi:hypothetical protein